MKSKTTGLLGLLEGGGREIKKKKKKRALFCFVGGSEQQTSITSEGDIVSETSWGNRVTIESVPYAVLMEANSVLVESYPVPGKLKTEIGSELANRFEWRYYLRGPSGGKLKPGEGE